MNSEAAEAETPGAETPGAETPGAETPGAETPGALGGVRIIDLTTVLMAPLATRMLADHGADVIRVEAPGGEAFLSSEPTRNPHMNWFALNLARNKRSITLDLKRDDGRAAMADLVATADVFVSNMRAKALERLDLDAATLRGRHPELIHCVANGYGSGGPYAGQAAYDDAIQAGSGLASLYERVVGEPRFSPAVVADKVCGLHVLQAVLAALFFRERTGKGQAIEMPMFETMVAFNLAEQHAGAIYDPPLGDVGYTRTMNANRKPYRCADGYVCLIPYTDPNWRAFFDFVGKPEILDDPRFADHTSRIANSEDLYAMVAELAPLHTVVEWLAFAEEVSIPAAEVMDLGRAHEDPHLQAVDLMPVVEHPTEGAYRAVRDPIDYSESPTRLRRHAPNPGEHTEEILTELGWDRTRIAAMTGNG